jgi:hypothetical protein
MQTAVLTLASIGRLAQTLDVSVAQIEEAAAELKLSPAQTLDGVPFYDAVATEALTGALSKRPAKNRRLVVIMRGGPFNGEKFERDRPAVGTQVEVHRSDKLKNRWLPSHSYCGTYTGGATMTIRYAGKVAAALDQFLLANAGEG